MKIEPHRESVSMMILSVDDFKCCMNFCVSYYFLDRFSNKQKYKYHRTATN